MKTRSLVLLAGLTALAAMVGIMLAQPSESVAAKAVAKGEVQLEFTIEIPTIEIPGIEIPTVDIPSVVAAVQTAVTNIGSSGLDGYSIDSFFDLKYQCDVFFEVDVRSSRSIQTEILSMSLTGTPLTPDVDPGAVIQSVIEAVRALEIGGTLTDGHVTVLK